MKKYTLRVIKERQSMFAEEAFSLGFAHGLKVGEKEAQRIFRERIDKINSVLTPGQKAAITRKKNREKNV
jgi:hypothetical protein